MKAEVAVCRTQEVAHSFPHARGGPNVPFDQKKQAIVVLGGKCLLVFGFGAGEKLREKPLR